MHGNVLHDWGSSGSVRCVNGEQTDLEDIIFFVEVEQRRYSGGVEADHRGGIEAVPCLPTEMCYSIKIIPAKHPNS